MQNYKTVVLGATTNASRYAWKATERLQKANIETIAVGNKKGYCAGIAIQNELQKSEKIQTITLYLNPKRQSVYIDYILNLNPKRVIFNPGTENPAFFKALDQHDISYEMSCTLVLLSTNQYQS